MRIALKLPGMNGTTLDSGLPAGVPTGGFFDSSGQLNGIGITIIRIFVDLFLVISILTAAWFIIVAGYNIMTSRGHKENIKNNREALIHALVGLALLFLSFFVMYILGLFLGIDLFVFLLLGSK